MSSFWALDTVSEGLSSLPSDLDIGAWAQRYSELFSLDEYDVGYRLVTTT